MHVSKKSLLTAGHAQCLPFWTHQSGFQSIIGERCGKSHDALCETWYELPKTTWMYVLATNIVWYGFRIFQRSVWLQKRRNVFVTNITKCILRDTITSCPSPPWVLRMVILGLGNSTSTNLIQNFTILLRDCTNLRQKMPDTVQNIFCALKKNFQVFDNFNWQLSYQLWLADLVQRTFVQYFQRHVVVLSKEELQKKVGRGETCPCPLLRTSSPPCPHL